MFLLPVLFYLACLTPGRDADPEAFRSKVGPYIEKVMALHEIPGLALSVVRDDELYYAGAFGVTDLDRGTAVKTTTPFHMASLSKAFVATAVMQLVERGALDLDAPLTDYLPYFTLDDPRYRNITIRMMLSHTSGIPDVKDYQWDRPEYDEGAAERLVRGLAGEKLVAAPGETYHYSNLAYDVLGHVITRVSGRLFEDYVTEYIFKPLDMNQSSFLWADISKIAAPHSWHLKPVVNPIYPYNRRHAPSSTLHTNVLDMANWVRANLKRGTWKNGAILRPESYEELWRPALRGRGKYNPGLGWFLGSHRGHAVVAHRGLDPGFAAFCMILPEKELALVLACNYDMAPVDEIAKAIVDLLLGREARVPKLPVFVPFARVYAAEGLAAARTAYRKWTKEKEDTYTFNSRQLNRVGVYYQEQGRLGKAHEIFNYNVELFPGSALAHGALAEVLLALGRREAALVHTRKALALEPSNPKARALRKKLEQRK